MTLAKKFLNRRTKQRVTQLLSKSPRTIHGGHQGAGNESARDENLLTQEDRDLAEFRNKKRQVSNLFHD